MIDRTLRRILLALFVFGTVGTGVELLLLEHFEKWWQRLPLGLIACALAVIAWHGFAGGRSSLRSLRSLMILQIASGVLGIWLHLQGNLEFEREMYPALGGLELFGKALRGAFPALAPGTMIQLGLLGMAYTFRHPGLARPSPQSTLEDGDQ